MIAIDHLRKHFGRYAAVNDMSFTARDGEITGLLGANGAGKTTTLRIIAGLLTPQAGTIHIDGGHGTLGALLDHAGLYGRLTARENIAYFGRLRRLSDVDAHVDRIVEQIGLGRIADRRVGGFSTGERLRVALGRAMVHNPRHLLLDEPTNGLDIPTVRSLRDLLRRMRDSGACILFSSHLLEDLQALCDRVVVIAQGEVAADCTPGQLLRKTGSASLEEAYLRLAGVREVAGC